MSECRKCEYKDLCRELPKDLSCDDVKRISNCGAEANAIMQKGKTMEQRLIDANALKKALCIICDMRHYCKSHDDDCWAKRRIDEQPTVDAVPAVRCKDCKWCEYPVYNNTKYGCRLLYRCVKPDWFCADGERRSK